MSRAKRNTIKTYGRHRQRVIAADIWSSDDEKKTELGAGVFSSSSSHGSSLDFSNQDTINDSLFSGPITRSTKKSLRGYNKENAGRMTNKRLLQKKLGSEGDSCSSTGSDSLFQSRRPRRALKDRNYKEEPVEDKPKYGGKRKRAPKTEELQTNQKSDSLSSVTNFSEFDDYSLVISGSPAQNNSQLKNGGIFSPRYLRSKSKIETSTPCAKRTCSANDINNLSIIDHVDEDVPSSPSVHMEQSSYAHDRVSNVPSCNISDSSNTSKSALKNSKNESPVNPCIVQLEKLRQSFLSMHVSHRTSKQSNFNHSDSLFSSFDEKNSLKCVTAESKLEGSESLEDDESDNDSEEEEEDTEENSDENLSKISEEDNDEESTENSEEEEQEDEGEDERNVTKFMLASSGDDNFFTAHLSLSSSGGSDVPVSGEDPDMSINEGGPDMSVNRSLLNRSHFDILTPQRKKSLTPTSPCSRVLEVCQQKDIETFQSCISSTMMRQCKKVGEGVYGEVFRTKRGNNSVALKIIPVEGDFEVNDEKQKSFDEILPEIVISVELSLLRENDMCYTQNFCEVQRVSCVKGRYPSKLLSEWNTFHDEKGSENDNPDMFKEDQLFIMFEFADGGKDLEAAQFNNIFEAKSVFEQVMFSLAVAEEALQFEHRDLHWGNVLVKKTGVKVHEYVVLGQTFQVESHGVHVSIIDFTLSRLDKDGCTIYTDLSTDESLFEGTGDYQFDIYRKMRELNKNDWKAFHAQTNVFWLHYLADKLIRGKRYKRNTKKDQTLLRNFRNFSKDILDYTSACDMIVSADFFSS
ncbi:uncharacterized protein LOC133188581 [Saccostrea echinata]|uniref:uncharacterized protein LOC133188581 n=1 Tax=Saccostrea echinata TaxID=191078 RepID=UPI002A805316|nr:uncharacterized protein LOC133188581 [Saccostrea echinata]XP_061180047.1 uncharacterized protein LOC133188581 [Saccostrea echinata]